jgi:hypothetical protein
MSSPDDAGSRRRRRRSRRAVDGGSEADQPIDQAGTVRRTGRSDRDETAHRAVAERGGRAKPAGRRSGSAGAAKTAGASKPAAQRRQPSEPSGRTLRETERGWRDLAGNGSSQLGVSGALRARDVSRPGPAELAEAERNVQLVRRQWQPPAAD